MVNVGSGLTRLDQVLANINSAAENLHVTARVDDSGTGILLTDASGGGGSLKVEAVGGAATAQQLGLLGQAATGTNVIDGSFRHSITVAATDTLQDVVDKINAAGVGVSASIINDGSSSNPYRLMLTSDASGTAGQIVMDPGTTGLNMTTFVQPRDALVYLGSPGNPNSIVLTSTTNQLTGVMDGVTMDLTGTSTQPVSLTVSRNLDSIVTQMNNFTDEFNSVVANIDSYTSYDADTSTKGALFGDGMVYNLRTRAHGHGGQSRHRHRRLHAALAGGLQHERRQQGEL